MGRGTGEHIRGAQVAHPLGHVRGRGSRRLLRVSATDFTAAGPQIIERLVERLAIERAQLGRAPKPHYGNPLVTAEVGLVDGSRAVVAIRGVLDLPDAGESLQPELELCRQFITSRKIRTETITFIRLSEAGAHNELASLLWQANREMLAHGGSPSAFDATSIELALGLN